MERIWFLILVFFLATNSLDKAESVQLFDEIFGEGWWDNDKAIEWNKLTLEHNFHHQIDRQNTQLGQIEPNSTDQNLPLTEPDHYGQIEPNSTDQNLLLTEPNHYGQSEHNSTDQNPPLTDSDHSDNDIGEEQTKITSNAEDGRKRKIIDKFHAMRNEFKKRGKFPCKARVTIENKIAKHLKVSRTKIYKWKKEFGLSRKVFYEKEERKPLIEKFDQMKAELKRVGFKNSYPNQIDKTVAKELGPNFRTIYRWNRDLGQTKPNKYSHNKQKEVLKLYYEIKNQNSKIRDEDIAKNLKIGSRTLRRWKNQFKREQFHPNSVDGHSVEENAAGSNV